MKLIDAHCHLANLADICDVPALITEAESAGITGFVSSALRRTEIDWHLANPDPRIVWHAGVHPNFDECDITPEDIESLLANGAIKVVGEIGLDRNNPDLETQKETLLKQLGTAHEHGAAVVLHIVGLQSESYTLLKQFPLRYLIHGYAGSVEGFRLLSKLDSVFTISSRILREDKHDLLREMVAQGRYLVETDMTQYYVKSGETNPLLRLLDVARNTLILSGETEKRFEEVQAESYAHIFGDR